MSLDIYEALRAKHRGDLYAEEVCCGSGGARRLDAWAARRSWSPWETVGYEVKVTRGDFMNDQKLHEYRRYVHRLFVVTPWKLVMPEELPPEVGLMWLTNTGTRLIRKKQSPRIEPPKGDLPILSILINRVHHIEDNGQANSQKDRKRHLMEWVRGEISDTLVGRWVAYETGLRLRELSMLRRDLESYERLRKLAEENGWPSLTAAASQSKNATGLPAEERKYLSWQVQNAGETMLRAAKEIYPEGGE